MATQGLLSIVDKETGNVLVKIVTGADGFNIPRLAEFIRGTFSLNGNGFHPINDTSIEKYIELCKIYEIWSEESTVILLDVPKIGYVSSYDLYELGTRYLDTFQDPEFNPRWKYGTAAYTEVIRL